MHYANVALTLLAAGSTAPLVEGSLIPRFGQRATHIVRDFFPDARLVSPPPPHAANATAIKHQNRRLVYGTKRHGKPTKRVVKKTKKKRSGKTCAARTSTSAVVSSATASATSAANSTIGGGYLVIPSSSSVAYSSSTPPASTSSAAWWEFASSSSVSSSSPSTTSSTAAATSSSSTSSSTWTLTDTYSGASFFDNWWFWHYDDPTHGSVEYVDRGPAWDDQLISINSAGNPIMKVETTEQVSGNRKSVRIHSNKVFTGGLILMDALHMPTGCGTWPAWWSVGPDWPSGGEIDILESVNAFSENQVSLHTGDGCTMPTWMDSTMSSQLTTGNFDSHNCASYATSNQGCGARAVGQETTVGAGFNSINGGVYAMRWDKDGITVWFFPRSSIPADITADAPEPSGWGTPLANFPSTSCSPYEFFHDHYSIFDTTLCGDWAGADAVWNYAGYAGQSQSCAAITGYSTCSDYVKNRGSAFADAYWEVQYVKYFNSTTEL